MIKLVNLDSRFQFNYAAFFEAQNYSKSQRTKENELSEIKKGATEHKSLTIKISQILMPRKNDYILQQQ